MYKAASCTLQGNKVNLDMGRVSMQFCCKTQRNLHTKLHSDILVSKKQVESTSLKLLVPPWVKKALTLGCLNRSFWGAHFTILTLLLTATLLFCTATRSDLKVCHKALIGAIADSHCAMAFSSAASAQNTATGSDC